MRIHTEKKTIKCEICEKMFKTKQEQRSHLETHKEKRERNKVCKLCKQSYMTIGGLRTHVNTAHSTLLTRNKNVMYVERDSLAAPTLKSTR